MSRDGPPSILIGLLLCAGPLWLWGVPLRWYFLKSDDFVYVAWSRTPVAVRGHLATPYNGHVVPLYMLETHLLARLAGTMEALPIVLGWASYATLVLAMAAIGHVVARESGRVAHGLAAMAAVGLTSVLGPTLLWYCGRARRWRPGRPSWSCWRRCRPGGSGADGGGWAGACWRRRRRRCSGRPGMPPDRSAWPISGPTAAPPADARRRSSRPARWPWPRSSGASWGGGSPRPRTSPSRPLGGVLAVDAVVAHSAQAVCEALVLNNLGLDAATTAGQALVFTALLAGLWAWSRWRPGADGSPTWPRINPLEAAGAVLVIATFGLIFAARGTESGFDSLRGAGLVRRHRRAGRRPVRRGVVRRAAAVAAARGDRGPRSARAPGRRVLHRRDARLAGSPRRSRDLRV